MGRAGKKLRRANTERLLVEELESHGGFCSLDTLVSEICTGEKGSIGKNELPDFIRKRGNLFAFRDGGVVLVETNSEVLSICPPKKKSRIAHSRSPAKDRSVCQGLGIMELIVKVLKSYGGSCNIQELLKRTPMGASGPTGMRKLESFLSNREDSFAIRGQSVVLLSDQPDTPFNDLNENAPSTSDLCSHASEQPLSGSLHQTMPQNHLMRAVPKKTSKPPLSKGTPTLLDKDETSQTFNQQMLERHVMRAVPKKALKPRRTPTLVNQDETSPFDQEVGDSVEDVPSDWELVDGDDGPFYFNTVTGETCKDPPPR